MRETRDHVTSASVRLLVATAALMAALAGCVGASDVTARTAHFGQRLAQRDADRQLNAGAVLVRSVEPGLRALRTPAPDSAFVRGLDAAMPVYWNVVPSGLEEGPADAAPIGNLPIGLTFDLEAVVRVILSLLALFIGLSALAGERSVGALPALLNQPISPRLVLAGKTLAAVLTLGLSLVTTCGAACLSLWLTVPSLMTPSFAVFVVAFALTSLLYLTTLSAGALAIGALTTRYRTAVFGVVATWLYVALIGPQLILVGTGLGASVPPRQTVEAEAQTVYRARERGTEDLLGRAARDLEGDRVLQLSHDQDQAVDSELERLWRADTQETREILAAIDARTGVPAATQDRWLARLTYASPGLLFLTVAQDLADTGPAAQRRWTDAAGAYQRALERQVFDDPATLTIRVPTDRAAALVTWNRRPATQFSDLPPFVPLRPSVAARVRLAVPRILGLVTYLLLLLVLATGAFRATGRRAA